VGGVEAGVTFADLATGGDVEIAARRQARCRQERTSRRSGRGRRHPTLGAGLVRAVACNRIDDAGGGGDFADNVVARVSDKEIAGCVDSNGLRQIERSAGGGAAVARDGSVVPDLLSVSGHG